MYIIAIKRWKQNITKGTQYDIFILKIFGNSFRFPEGKSFTNSYNLLPTESNRAASFHK